MPKATRQEFIRLMATGGAALVATPFAGLVYDDLGLTDEARRAGLTRRAGRPEGESEPPPADWGRLRFRCAGGESEDWSVHPHGDLNLIKAINGAATVHIGQRWHAADIADLDAMAKFPLLFMHAENTPELTAAEMANLREYLLRGGFLYAEDCVNGKRTHGKPQGDWDFFFQKMKTVLTGLVPDAEVVRLADDHEIFHCFFDLPAGQPHMQGQRHGAWGLVRKGRLMAYLSPSDAHCAWTNPIWFANRSQDAIKIGTNVYIYAMTH
jgi:hypothetical protein